MNYCEVIDNQITRYNISQPRAWGNYSFPPDATPADYLKVNLWPVVGTAPAYDQATQRLDGPVYTVGDSEVIKTYTVVDIPVEDLQKALAEQLETALEEHIDKVAQSYTWKDIGRAIGAAGTVNPFQANAIALKDWWAACWIKAHEIQSTAIASGIAPTKEEFLAEMPVFEEV